MLELRPPHLLLRPLGPVASFRVMERLGMTRVGERIVGPRRVRALYYRLTR
ncbi:hypothetical protein JQX13_41080 [Archangium violaceum]|uniref:hypothetical protein n=1 Tax=Archangium violaceum TaxID=83451 RepID=UPI00193C856A|nr:hypothetical protein [Archangium violaceum]QRK06434.1 hypothetical protein JQX13_41080 [Archangium violaceum]